MTSRTTPLVQKEERQSIWGPLAMTAISLAVLGAGALWHIRQRSSDTAPAVAGRTAATQNAVASDETPRAGRSDTVGAAGASDIWGGGVAGPSAPSATAGPPTPTLYIAATEAQAQTMRAALADLDAIRMTWGEPPSVAAVIRLDAPGADADMLFEMLRSPAIAVIDLRAFAVAPSAEPEGAGQPCSGLPPKVLSTVV